MSQKVLAEASGVSLRMVGGIENGATSVSTATLDRIGIALNATLADLVADPSASRTARIDRAGWSGEQGGEGVLRWSIDVRREVELWEWRLEPGERYQAAADPAGWHVMIFVVAGRLTLELETETIELSAANHVFDSAQVHAFANSGNEAVRFFRCTAW
ncbi:helix-turn-helix domain-containing protein [Sphingomonas psychrotolerans]|uniref:Cro/Cl family transcriptional regulator n=1 Tax=Sphingomonas psychrotolerans TaxID=1327635 RepID=A0A2K8MBC6_9SPHN|nr:cupin domain-containing protein [Sphingomonas psychrotolerans]ATY31163.1 Cro/Cl family transcriptional regulator [Sphingomonas psychrotolerans]